ncbi:uncharacterized protein LOC124159665 [Ischnura elegans]|uniref:uncharacterized protein LOC124159665 n=1 Tax=Ischnura elegans TaxID=197161 RepID=UPI001ED869EE|nr:uncharacterized protein LOC124159665 [Ischnura elegans]
MHCQISIPFILLLILCIFYPYQFLGVSIFPNSRFEESATNAREFHRDLAEASDLPPCFDSTALLKHMTMSAKALMVTAATLTLVICLGIVEACVEEEKLTGCKIIDGGICVCGIGCYSDYQYNDMAECINGGPGRHQNICLENPCLNGGACSPTAENPGYKCSCKGTGHYGSTCEHACSSSTSEGTTEEAANDCSGN